MALTELKIRAAKPGLRGFRLPDSGGLHLFITPKNVRSWRWRYEVDGIEGTRVLGRYPGMSLADARRARDAARRQLHEGEPVALIPEPAGPTFREAATAWHTLNVPRWKAHHAADVLASLEREVFPTIGDLPVNAVTPGQVLAALRLMEARGAIPCARKVKQRCSRVFGFSIASGWTQTDPSAGLRDALAPLPPKGHMHALTDLDEVRRLIADIDVASGHPATKVALRFLGLTAARPGEVGGMRWTELHDDEWHIPAERMKMKTLHIVPLVPASLACLNAIRPLTGRSPFVFPNAFNPIRPISDGTMRAMLIRLGYLDRHVPHGWRATFSSIMNERFPADRHIIDLMLAHTPKDAVERAYNRATHSARRRELAQAWADLLLEGAAPANTLVEGPRRSSA